MSVESFEYILDTAAEQYGLRRTQQLFELWVARKRAAEIDQLEKDAVWACPGGVQTATYVRAEILRAAA